MSHDPVLCTAGNRLGLADVVRIDHCALAFPVIQRDDSIVYDDLLRRAVQ
jgi:hypothetical protein